MAMQSQFASLLIYMLQQGLGCSSYQNPKGGAVPRGNSPGRAQASHAFPAHWQQTPGGKLTWQDLDKLHCLAHWRGTLEGRELTQWSPGEHRFSKAPGSSQGGGERTHPAGAKQAKPPGMAGKNASGQPTWWGLDMLHFPSTPKGALRDLSRPLNTLVIFN